MSFVWRVWKYIKLIFVRSPPIVSEQVVDQPPQIELPSPPQIMLPLPTEPAPLRFMAQGKVGQAERHREDRKT